jgi:cyclohexanone monooxygenase
VAELGHNQADRDVLVVGGGFAGMYMVHLLREAGFSVQAFDKASDFGGTWWWNRYPGARCDVESFDYSYSFSPELDQEWDWSERYAAQPEILRYAHFVADKLAIRPFFRFETVVTAAHFDESSARWTITTQDDERFTGRFVVMATGLLSVPKDPDIPGLQTFAGERYLTSRWPHEPVDFANKRVGVIGTGSSGIQAITEIAKQAGELYVFQRTPTFSLPARNAPLSKEQLDAQKATYPARRAEARASFAGLLTHAGAGAACDAVPEDERRRLFEAAWSRGGLTTIGIFNDVMISEPTNERVADMVRAKIDEVVTDPAIAEKLKARGYPLGSRRVALDIDYHAVYNQANVHLVDLKTEPLVEVVPEGVRTAATSYPLDILVLATGFDAFTGPLEAIDIRGRGGETIKEHWAHGPNSLLGLAVNGFPNMFTITGPSSPTALTNVIAMIEQHVEWVARLIGYARDNHVASFEADAEAEAAWVQQVATIAGYTLYPKGNGWYQGANIPGKPRVFMAYIGGLPAYRQICDDIADNGYKGFRLTHDAPATA